jgi:hypothetical protein
MSQAALKNNASIALAKKVMNVSQQQGSDLLQMLNQPVIATPHPTLGHHIDLKG